MPPTISPVESTAAPHWSVDVDILLQRLGTTREGLDAAEAARRLEQAGPNRIRDRARFTALRIFWNQIGNPLLLILVFAAIASAFTGEWSDSIIVLTIAVLTVGIGFAREHTAHRSAALLQARIRAHARVRRNGSEIALPVEDVVPGDVVLLSAGSIVPADGVLLEATDFYVNEAVLTGESFPIRKQRGPTAASASLAERTNCVFLGTNVRSGAAVAVVTQTGLGTAFGAIARRLATRPPATEFDRGVRRFGYLLTVSMLLILVVVFAVHVIEGRPAIETLLFSVALAVGLSPELLPAILTVNLARGAQMMAERGVLVRRLNAIENLGSMDVLCTDKTGTLTEGVVSLEGAYDPFGQPDPSVRRLAAINAALETGLHNPLDDAILAGTEGAEEGVRKTGEIPFDFVRKRVTVAIAAPGGIQLITKGAFHTVVEVCSALSHGGPLDAAARAALETAYEDWSRRGIRVMAVATRGVSGSPEVDRELEARMTFAGFLTFLDRPKPDAAEAIGALARLGVSVKIITGDATPVAEHVAHLVGLTRGEALSGRALDEMSDEALWHTAERTTVFAEVDPNQKERIIRALRRTGHVVGFLGDGVNDTPAMHAADTSLSVDSAVDVARETADFVLLERDLDVIRRGIEEGRRTFANTLKYLLTTMSANLGNMMSMAAASLLLPFLPLLPGQILLNNFLSDVPAIGIATDSVDEEMIARPERWNMRFIARFMAQFGALSSLFDLVTFGVLLGVFKATPALFRTGWFVESLLTELVIALVVRTRRPFYRSRPGALLLWSTLALVVVAGLVPYMPGAAAVGFVRLPMRMLAATVAITTLYVAGAEALKKRF